MYGYWYFLPRIMTFFSERVLVHVPVELAWWLFSNIVLNCSHRQRICFKQRWGIWGMILSAAFVIVFHHFPFNGASTPPTAWPLKVSPYMAEWQQHLFRIRLHWQCYTQRDELRYFTILDACSSGENRQTHTNLWGFPMRGYPMFFLFYNIQTYPVRLGKLDTSNHQSRLFASFCHQSVR